MLLYLKNHTVLNYIYTFKIGLTARKPTPQHCRVYTPATACGKTTTAYINKKCPPKGRALILYSTKLLYYSTICTVARRSKSNGRSTPRSLTPPL